MTAETDAEFVERMSRAIPYNAHLLKSVDLIRLFALARRGAAVQETWPEGFFPVGRLVAGRCASDGCGQIPSIRMERDGIGSNYCEPCARKIAWIITKHPLPPPPAGETNE